jgi:hypothetical protein
MPGAEAGPRCRKVGQAGHGDWSQSNPRRGCGRVTRVVGAVINPTLTSQDFAIRPVLGDFLCWTADLNVYGSFDQSDKQEAERRERMSLHIVGGILFSSQNDGSGSVSFSLCLTRETGSCLSYIRLRTIQSTPCRYGWAPRLILNTFVSKYRAVHPLGLQRERLTIPGSRDDNLHSAPSTFSVLLANLLLRAIEWFPYRRLPATNE